MSSTSTGTISLPNTRGALMFTQDGLVDWRLYALLGLDVLIEYDILLYMNSSKFNISFIFPLFKSYHHYLYSCSQYRLILVTKFCISMMCLGPAWNDEISWHLIRSQCIKERLHFLNREGTYNTETQHFDHHTAWILSMLSYFRTFCHENIELLWG